MDEPEAVAPAAAVRRYELMLDSLGDAFVTLDPDLVVTSLHPGAGAVLGVPGDQLLGRPLTDAPPFATAAFATACRRVLVGSHPVAFRHRHATSGTWFDVRATPSDGGLTLQLVDVGDAPSAADLQAREAQQRAVAELGQLALGGAALDTLLAEAVQWVETVFQVGRVAVMMMLDDGETLELRAGLSPEQDVRDETLLMTRTDLVGTALYESLVSARPARVPSPRYPTRLRPDGLPPTTDSVGIESDVSVPVFDENGIWGLLAAASDRPDAFTDGDLLFLQQAGHVLSTAIRRHQVEDRLRHQANHDALTGLPNRSVLYRRIEEAARAASAGAGTAALLLLDLDGFKDVNDSLGHTVGDSLLAQLAERLHKAGSEWGTVARLGGDEFAVCVPGPLTDEGLDTVLQRLVAAVEEPFLLYGLEVSLSASIGVTLAPHHGTTVATLMRHADVAMYRAKSERLGWALYDAGVDSPSSDRLAMISELRAGIRGDALELHYQPVVDLVSGDVGSVEALVRWRRPSRGLVPPGEFIGLAEQTGLIAELTAWVVREAADQARQWREEGLDLRVAVNLSVAALRDPSTADALTHTLAAEAELLSVEVTESSLIDVRARSTLDRLASQGVVCAIDDFGTGWSSLAYLRTLPVSVLKLDRFFADGLGPHDRDLALVRAVVDLARTLSIEVVAEGVETEEVAEHLRRAGVRMAQGFVYARPMPATQLRQWLEARRHTRPRLPLQSLRGGVRRGGKGPADRQGAGRQPRGDRGQDRPSLP